MSPLREKELVVNGKPVRIARGRDERKRCQFFKRQRLRQRALVERVPADENFVIGEKRRAREC